jgi:hypothetical protein
MKLRCWPGCLAIITDECDDKSMRGKTLVCEAAQTNLSGKPCWTYRGPRIFGYVHGRLMECLAVADAVLRPLTPPPGTDDTNITEHEPEEVTA